MKDIRNSSFSVSRASKCPRCKVSFEEQSINFCFKCGYQLNKNIQKSTINTQFINNKLVKTPEGQVKELDLPPNVLKALSVKLQPNSNQTKQEDTIKCQLSNFLELNNSINIESSLQESLILPNITNPKVDKIKVSDYLDSLESISSMYAPSILFNTKVNDGRKQKYFPRKIRSLKTSTLNNQKSENSTNIVNESSNLESIVQGSWYWKHDFHIDEECEDNINTKSDSTIVPDGSIFWGDSNFIHDISEKIENEKNNKSLNSEQLSLDMSGYDGSIEISSVEDIVQDTALEEPEDEELLDDDGNTKVQLNFNLQIGKLFIESCYQLKQSFNALNKEDFTSLLRTNKEVLELKSHFYFAKEKLFIATNLNKQIDILLSKFQKQANRIRSSISLKISQQLEKIKQLEDFFSKQYNLVKDEYNQIFSVQTHNFENEEMKEILKHGNEKIKLASEFLMKLVRKENILIQTLR